MSAEYINNDSGLLKHEAKKHPDNRKTVIGIYLFQRLCRNKQLINPTNVSYFDKTIITEAYIAPMSNGHYMVLPTESAYMGDSINSSTSYIEAMSVMKNSAFDSSYRGYALISGECHGSSLYEPSFASKLNITPKIDMLYICYIEPR